MMYQALSKCRINGRSYGKCEMISPGELRPYEAMRLKNLGIICETAAVQSAASGSGERMYSEAEVKRLAEFLQMKQAEAAAYVSGLDKVKDYDFLQLAEMTDGRAKVAEAVKLILNDCKSKVE